MKQLLCITLLLFSINSFSQTTISGKVTNKNNNPLVGVNIYIEGTYDGASTDTNGQFSFETQEKGSQTLVASMMSYETHYETGDLSYFKNITITLTETVNQLTGVTLTAGTFEAGGNSKASVLKPLDIVTTAGALGDFVAALQTLPGTSTVNESGRLFVRGGTANETQIFVDGLRVFQPFLATGNNVPTRGRLSPFLFKGISFSTGGYSAEYGQALSSVLLLNTTDIPDEEKTDIGIMSVGGNLGHTKIWGNKSLSVNTSYLNPYESLIPSNQGVSWNKPYESISGEAVFRNNYDKGILKLYTGYSKSNLDINQEDINYEDFINFKNKNSNLYFNASYKHFYDKEWTLFTGASISVDKNDIGFITNTIENNETATHTKIKLKKSFTNRFSLNFGAEHFTSDFNETFKDTNDFSFDSNYTDNLTATFAEANIFFSNKFALKLGARAEYSSLLNDITFSPRVAIAHKNNEHSQFSFAYGDFYQNPSRDYLKFETNLQPQKTSHYILNYQSIKNKKTFRIEAYYKDYKNLVKFNTNLPQFNSEYTNLGGGHATGLDIFWRANKSIKNLDYWASYSYLDTKRDHRNFRERATPNFAAKHNASLVTKYFIKDLRSQVGLSYSYASGRPYNNPNTPDFFAEKTKSYNNLSFNWAYLISQQKILFFSVNNIAGFNNINGYQYANTPDATGNFNRRTIRPTADSFFFVGFFWTLSKNKTSNQLDNL